MSEAKWIPVEEIFECSIDSPKRLRVCARKANLQGKCGIDDNNKPLGCPYALEYFKHIYSDRTTSHGIIKISVSEDGNAIKGTKIIGSETNQVITINRGERIGV